MWQAVLGMADVTAASGVGGPCVVSAAQPVVEHAERVGTAVVVHITHHQLVHERAAVQSTQSLHTQPGKVLRVSTC